MRCWGESQSARLAGPAWRVPMPAVVDAACVVHGPRHHMRQSSGEHLVATWASVVLRGPGTWDPASHPVTLGAAQELLELERADWWQRPARIVSTALANHPGILSIQE